MSGVKGSRAKGRNVAAHPGSGAPFSSKKGTNPNPRAAYSPDDIRDRTRKSPSR